MSTHTDTLHQHLAPEKARARGLPLDPEEAAASILNRLHAGDFQSTAPALAALRESNLALLGSSPEGIRESLARQATLLEALFVHLAARGLGATQSEAQARLIHAAVGCQQACTRTLIALGASAPSGEG